LVSEIEPNGRERWDQYALLPAGEVARNFSVIRNRFAAVSLVFFDGCLPKLDFLMLNSINMHILFIDIQKYPFHSQNHVKLIDFLRQKIEFPIAAGSGRSGTTFDKIQWTGFRLLKANEWGFGSNECCLQDAM
jgi:hypothetical protein